MTSSSQERRRLLLASAAAASAALLAACGGGGGSSSAAPSPPSPVPPPPPPGSPPPPPPAGSPAPHPKRGIAYDLKNAQDFSALGADVAWYYNWASQPDAAMRANPAMAGAMKHVPMLWNGNFDDAAIVAMLKADASIENLLVLNEPNLTDQANLTPAAAAALWPRYEAVAAAAGVRIVGPAMTWGTMAGFADPITWLDAFYAAYRGANGGRDPRIDALAFHWYDYGLAAQLDRLKKYGKPFWVTEFANWHSQQDGAQIDSAAKQQAQMAEMVAICESRDDVERYAWFTGRWNNDTHFTSLFAAQSGVLTALGAAYLTQP